MSQAPTVVHAAKFASDGGGSKRGIPHEGTQARERGGPDAPDRPRRKRVAPQGRTPHGKQGKADGEERRGPHGRRHRTPPNPTLKPQ